MKFNFKNQQVLITGGASGIGKIMVGYVLAKGANAVAVWDINEAGLAQLKQEMHTYHERIFTFKADLSDLEDIKATAQQTKDQLGSINVVINNAGIVVGKYFHENSHADVAKTLQVNSLALMHIALEFLPGMMEANFGAICNIGSMAGLISNPKMSVYCASKWAANGWSDSLRLEMKQLQKNISVTTVMPYYISTGMFEGVKSPLIPIVKPETAAAKIIKGIENKRAIVAMPIPYWFIRLSQGILPISAFDWVMEHIFGVYHSMQGFKGRA